MLFPSWIWIERFNNVEIAIKVYFNARNHIQDHRDLKKASGGALLGAHDGNNIPQAKWQS